MEAGRDAGVSERTFRRWRERLRDEGPAGPQDRRIARHALFCELYTDRGSHNFHTPKAGEPVAKSRRTQVA